MIARLCCHCRKLDGIIPSIYPESIAFSGAEEIVASIITGRVQHGSAGKMAFTLASHVIAHLEVRHSQGQTGSVRFCSVRFLRFRVLGFVFSLQVCMPHILYIL